MLERLKITVAVLRVIVNRGVTQATLTEESVHVISTFAEVSIFVKSLTKLYHVFIIFNYYNLKLLALILFHKEVSSLIKYLHFQYTHVCSQMIYIVKCYGTFSPPI